MATREEIYTAIRNADKAGDSAGVRKLGEYLQTLPVESEPAAPAMDHQKRLAEIQQELQQIEADKPGLIGNTWGVAKDFAKGAGDVALNLGAPIITTPVAGIAGAATTLASAPFIGMDRASSLGTKVIENTSSLGGLVRPYSDVGQEAMSSISAPFEALAGWGDRAGQKAADVTGSPAVGSVVNTAVQAAPAILMRKGGPLSKVRIGGTAEGANTAANAAANAAAEAPNITKAKAYAANTLGVDWDSLAASVQQKLGRIAMDAKALDNLDPAAVTRETRLTALDLPATRGQVTRNLAQITREENISKSDVGAPIRDITAQQDAVLHGHLDTLRGSTGGKATTRQGLGKSVQEAERGKAKVLENDYNKAYADAREQGVLAEPANITPLQEWLKNPTNARNAGYLKQAIDDYLPKDANGKPIPGGERRISINDLEEIRKEASANRATPGPAAHFAGEAIKVIDDILDTSGGDLYQTARSKYKAYNDEFSRQGRVAKLVDEKGYTTDRAVALEDTLDHVLRSSAESIAEIKQSLTKGGNAKTQLQGLQAWKDIQAGVIDHLKEAAAGKRAITGEKSQLQFNSSFRDVFAELDADGKIDVLFSPQQAAKLRQIHEAVGDVRTKPAGRISGSDTTPRLIAMLENFGSKLGSISGKVPVLGDIAVGMGKKLYQAGKEESQARAATTTPLNEALSKAASKEKRSQVADAGKQLIPLSQVGAQRK